MSVYEADTPFAPSVAHAVRIQERAHALWEREGRPFGHYSAYAERARELDAIEGNLPAQLPNPLVTPPRLSADGVLVEEASLQENLGEFPARLTDEGETMPTPSTRLVAREFRDGER
jgi:hypothetical protein